MILGVDALMDMARTVGQPAGQLPGDGGDGPVGGLVRVAAGGGTGFSGTSGTAIERTGDR